MLGSVHCGRRDSLLGDAASKGAVNAVPVSWLELAAAAALLWRCDGSKVLNPVLDIWHPSMPRYQNQFRIGSHIGGSGDSGLHRMLGLLVSKRLGVTSGEATEEDAVQAIRKPTSSEDSEDHQ